MRSRKWTALITGWLKKVSCYHSTTAYFFEPRCLCKSYEVDSAPLKAAVLITCVYFIGLFVEVGHNQDCFVLPFAVDVLPPVLTESVSVNQF